MAKETETERLIRTLEFLKEPHGSTIPTIVKAMNGDGPQVSLKTIMQTLRGCLENGILKVSDGRVKLKQLNVIPETKPKEENPVVDSNERPKSGCQKQGRSTKPSCSSKCYFKRTWKARTPKMGLKRIPHTTCDADPPKAPKGGDGGKAGQGQAAKDKDKDNKSPNSPCPPCPKCKKRKPRSKSKCSKPKPKCPKPKPKCSKPKPKCSKPKSKSTPPKKKCKPKKPRSKKPCRKVKIQPYCKKKKKM